MSVDGGKGADWQVPFQNDLDRAQKIRGELSRAPGDSERMCYVAGWARATPCDLMIEQDADGRDRLAFKATGQGDGRVPWASGTLDHVKTWYLAAAHGELARDASGFPGIRELLEEGRSTSLSETPPETRDALDDVELIEERSPLFPTHDDLVDSALGGARQDRRDRIASKIQVDIVHGNLAFASYPVMVGHYHQDSIVSAEAFLDDALGGQLTLRHRLRRYPGQLNSSAIVWSDRDDDKKEELKGSGRHRSRAGR